MADFDFLDPIPKTTVPVKLPSRGLLYPKGTPMNSGQLHLTPMTMVEEAIFYNFKADGNPVDRILKRCITETVDVNALLRSDKFFLFMMLRAVTYGAEYSFTWTCPAMKSIREACGCKNNTTVNIPGDFKMKYLSDEDEEPFVVRLPDSQKEISFRMLRGYDDPEIEKYSAKIEDDRKMGLQREDTTTAYRLSRQIVAVDGHVTKNAPEQKLLVFVLSLSARDTQFLKTQIGHYTPGINTDVTLRCSECGAVQEGDLPVTAEFFRCVDQDEGAAMGSEVRPDVLPEDVSEGDRDDGPSGAEVAPEPTAASPKVGDGSGATQARRLAPRRHRNSPKRK